MFPYLDWPLIIEQLENFATSALTKEDLRHIGPLKNEAAALTSFSEIEEARILLNLGHRPGMESLDFFSTWFERLKRQSVLKTLELKDVRRFLREIKDLRDTAQAFSSPWLQGLQNHLLNTTEPLSAIDQIITPSGDIRVDASEELSQLFRNKQERERSLHHILNKIVKQHNLETVLQDRFVTNREGRWVLPVKSGMRHSLEGIIHDVSQTKQTVYMEPQEVVILNNEIRETEIKIEKEIEKLLTELTHYLHRYVSPFDEAKQLLLQADLRLAQAQMAQVLQANPCRFSKERVILKELRHPLLSLQDTEVVSNDVELDVRKRVLLLSGPNAGGKTVLLKSIGLAAQMARCGLPICADEDSELPFFQQIKVAVGDEQSVHQNLSTFAAHLKTLTEATEASGSHYLVLVDEICSATDPEEGSALAKSFIEHFAKQQVFAIVTSHLGALKEGWAPDSGVLNGRLEYDEISGTSTYKLFLGLPGQSQAIKTARKIGVPSSIIERALSLIHPQSRERQNKLDELENIKDSLLEQQQAAQKERHKFEEYKDKYFELIEKFKKEKEQWLNKSLKQAQTKIDELLEQAKSQQQTKGILEIKNQLPQIVKSPERRQILSAEDFKTAYSKGSLVFVPQLNQDGVIQSDPDPKGMITVLAQSMRVQVNWKELQPPRSAPAHQNSSRLAGHHGLRHEERVVDLRGQRVDEALGELEAQLDLAMRGQEERLRVIHGHGTEALKKSIRTFLSRSIYVRKWKAGDSSSGGDGVTWVELDEGLMQ